MDKEFADLDSVLRKQGGKCPDCGKDKAGLSDVGQSLAVVGICDCHERQYEREYQAELEAESADGPAPVRDAAGTMESQDAINR